MTAPDEVAELRSLLLDTAPAPGPGDMDDMLARTFAAGPGDGDDALLPDAGFTAAAPDGQGDHPDGASNAGGHEVPGSTDGGFDRTDPDPDAPSTHDSGHHDVPPDEGTDQDEGTVHDPVDHDPAGHDGIVEDPGTYW